MEKVKFQLGAEVQLFKTDLVGMIDSDSGCIVIRQPNAGFDAPGMTVQEFLDEVTGLFQKVGVVIPEVNLPQAIEEVIEGVSVSMKEIFLIIQNKEPKSVEFAVWVSMESSRKLQDLFPVSIKQAYVKVWNTSRQVILDEMQISTVQALFDRETQQGELPDNKSGDKKKNEDAKQ